MEPLGEKRARYIYNPYVLNLAYQKLYYLERVRRIYVWRRHRFCDARCGMDSEERYRMIRENVLAEQIVADVFHALGVMTQERFVFDLYHCNYEYVLFRLYSLLIGHTGATLPPGLTAASGELPIETKCVEVLERWGEEGGEANWSIFGRAMERYLERHYFVGLVNYERSAVTRTSLLLNIKHTIEAKVRLRQGDDMDYTIEYSREVVLSMMYVFFVNEFRALLQEDSALLRASYQTCRVPVTEEERIDCECRLKRTQRDLALLEELYAQLNTQNNEEFYAFSLVNAFPATAATTAVNDALGRYTMRAPLHQRTVFRVKDVASDDFVVREKRCDHIRYLTLRKNRHLYEYITRRMLFEHQLLLSHQECCTGGAGEDGYVHCCQVCNYLAPQTQQALTGLYTASTTYAYYLCEYVVRSSGERPADNETQLARHLETLIVDPIPELDSLVYKNAWQTMCLFGDAGHPGRLGLFYTVNADEVVQYVRENYMSLEHGPASRQDLVLRLSRRHTASPRAAHLEKWHKALVLDIDIFTLMMRAVGHQQSEIEKYARSLGECALKDTISPTMITIYTLYLQVLDDMM